MWFWVCLALTVAIGSALVPFVNIELFVIGLAMQRPEVPWALLAGVVAIGQVSAKLVFFYAARGDIHLPAFMVRRQRERPERSTRWTRATKRARDWVHVVRERCERHPHWLLGTYGVSSVTGFPPYMATVVLAGLARMSVRVFLLTGVIGRFIRFSVVAASPFWFASCFHH